MWDSTNIKYDEVICLNEKFETAKAEYNACTEIEDIWSNPIVKMLIGIIPKISSLVDNSIEKMLELHQKKKLEELFEIILSDNKITMDEVRDIDIIMEFAKTIEVVNRLILDDKINIFAKLLKSEILSENRNPDEFEELLNKLNILSLREMGLLHSLYLVEREKMICNSNGEKVFNPSTTWKTFVEKAKVDFGFNETEITSYMLGIMRTGFCMAETKSGLSQYGMTMYTTPLYEKLIQRIENEY